MEQPKNPDTPAVPKPQPDHKQPSPEPDEQVLPPGGILPPGKDG